MLARIAEAILPRRPELLISAVQAALGAVPDEPFWSSATTCGCYEALHATASTLSI
jgi:hypothetical protein